MDGDNCLTFVDILLNRGDTTMKTEQQTVEKISKDNAMLVDVQYVPENRREKLPDYLYLIWKNLDFSTEKKF